MHLGRPERARAISRYYVFSALLIPDEQKLLQGIGQVTSTDEEGSSSSFPRNAPRSIPARSCATLSKAIQVESFKNGSRFEGTLVDFSPIVVSARAFAPRHHNTFGWLNAGAPVMVVLSSDREILFPATAGIVSDTGGRRSREYVLEPTQDHIQRFETPAAPQRSPGIRSRADYRVRAPAHRQAGIAQVLDLSSSGLAVEENARNAVLMPGLMIPGSISALPATSGFLVELSGLSPGTGSRVRRLLPQVRAGIARHGCRGPSPTGGASAPRR